jgi:hypothetical protein
MIGGKSGEMDQLTGQLRNRTDGDFKYVIKRALSLAIASLLSF